eukprot:COSAG01_NODE_3105_length_6577_cov_4.068077_7_plen_207_part_00
MTDNAAARDRIQAVYSKQAGWQFGCLEHKAAPDAVRSCLDEHEAMEFRPQDDSGPCRHEFPAMVEHLLLKMCRVQFQLPSPATGVLTNELGSPPSLRDEYERTQHKVQALDAEVAHLNRLLIGQDNLLMQQVHAQGQRLQAQEDQLSKLAKTLKLQQSTNLSEGVPLTNHSELQRFNSGSGSAPSRSSRSEVKSSFCCGGRPSSSP